MKKINGPEYPTLSGNKPKKLVIFIHGYGSNGMDLIGLVDYMNQDLPDFYFCSPNAPFKVSMGYNSYQWFSLDERNEEAIFKSISDNVHFLEDYIAAKIKELDITYEDVFLVGFSQGSMLSLYLAPRFKHKFAGVVALSGALVKSNALENEVINKPPILLIHGDSDEVVGVDEFFAAKEKLEELNFNLKASVIKNMGHNINDQVISLMKKFFIENQ